MKVPGDWGRGYRFHEGAVMLAMRKRRGGTLESIKMLNNESQELVKGKDRD